MAIQPIGKLTDKNEQYARSELAYEWIAEYKDDTRLYQYDEKNQLVHHFGHIDQDKIVRFILESKRDPKDIVTIDLENGLFYINDKIVDKLKTPEGDTIPLGLFLKNRNVTSSWGNKAKLIYFRHVRRDFIMGEGRMVVIISYEVGWEAEVDGKRQKHTILLDDTGRFTLPPISDKGFKAL